MVLHIEKDINKEKEERNALKKEKMDEKYKRKGKKTGGIFMVSQCGNGARWKQ